MTIWFHALCSKSHGIRYKSGTDSPPNTIATTGLSAELAQGVDVAAFFRCHHQTAFFDDTKMMEVQSMLQHFVKWQRYTVYSRTQTLSVPSKEQGRRLKPGIATEGAQSRVCRA
jgi:hypothetical protein